MRRGDPRPRRLLSGLVCLTLLLAGCSADQQPEPGGTPTDQASPSASRTASPEPERTDPLTGGRYNGGEVFAVKIENTAAARPQVGLDAADIVVVEEVEARITRLIGVYHSTFPGKVGPVRSARNTDVQLLPLFGKPGLVYSGANSKVQRQIRKASVVPIERSDRDRSRTAPHNVMVDLDGLADRYRVGKVRDIGWRFDADAGSWSEAAEAGKASATIGADTMRFDYRDGRYAVRWNGKGYRAAKGEVRTDNVIVMSVRNHRDNDTTSNISVVSQTTGSGKVTVYRDGRKMSGTWSRKKTSDRLTLTADGADITLKPGKTWLLLDG